MLHGTGDPKPTHLRIADTRASWVISINAQKAQHVASDGYLFWTGPEDRVLDRVQRKSSCSDPQPRSRTMVPACWEVVCMDESRTVYRTPRRLNSQGWFGFSRQWERLPHGRGCGAAAVGWRLLHECPDMSGLNYRSRALPECQMQVSGFGEMHQMQHFGEGPRRIFSCRAGPGHNAIVHGPTPIRFGGQAANHACRHTQAAKMQPSFCEVFVRASSGHRDKVENLQAGASIILSDPASLNRGVRK